MRIRSPVSRGSFRFRVSAFDAIWAFISPWLALWLRDAQVLTVDSWQTAALYSLSAFASAILAFLIFRIRDGMTHHFSVNDALDVAKAVGFAAVMSGMVVFTFTRLDGIPRSTPLIHALVLAAGLIVARILVRLLDGERPIDRSSHTTSEHIVLIGSTQLGLLYIKLLNSYAPNRYHVIAILDHHPHMIGRSIAGRRVVGPPQHLEAVIDEYVEHGIRTDRVIVGGESDLLPEEVMREIIRSCKNRRIKLDYVPRLIGLSAIEAAETKPKAKPKRRLAPEFSVQSYFQAKRIFDFIFSMVFLLVLLPLLLIVGGVVLLDVGSPILYWQQRIGLGGRSFLLHKFRTLKPSFNWDGDHIPGSERQSWVGDLIRKTRLDELPQLLNVLVGDMSLIGPRPLLPHDQPPDPSIRLAVLPGITGWAQVNGGKLLTVEVKNELDEWYVRNASPWLDLRILFLTLLFIFQGERRLSHTTIPNDKMRTQVNVALTPAKRRTKKRKTK